MVKKLLLKVFTFWALILTSFVGWGQCPTSVSISASPGTTICAGTNVTFTASPNGGSGTLTYEWKIDGVSAGTNSNVFTSPNLQNGNKITVSITSAGETTCSLTSSAVTMTVNPVVTPTVTINPTKTSICPGESITFQAVNTYGGTNPQYQWFINSSSSVAKTGASVTFSSSDFTEGNNTVRVRLTSNINCASSTTAEATSATFVLRPDATISTPTNKDQTVCINTPLQAISFALGGGATNATVTGLPSGISGSKSGSNFVLSGSPTTAGTFAYTINTTGTCAQTTATGTITVNPNATIALTSGNNSQTVCAAGGVTGGNISPITYSIGETGTGATVTGLPTGITGSYNNGVFTIQGSSSVAGTHSYSVKATGSCGDSAPLTGSIVITANKAPSVSITSNDADNTICAGTSVTFTATPTNGGANPTYQWKLNGSPVGTNSSKYTTTALTNGQTVTVDMSSSETCLTTATVTSNAITTAVNPNLTPEVTITTSDSDICPGDSVTFTATPVHGGANPVYQWKVGNTNVGTSSPTYTTTALTNGQSVSVVITSNETCLATATATSNSLTTTVQPPVPATPGAITGSQQVCGTATGLVYSVPAVTNAESYTWTLPTGWSVTGGAGTRSITVSASSTPGNISVSAVNSCGTSSQSTLAVTTVNGVPATPGTITSSLPSDNKNICPPLDALTFSVPAVTGATSYNWILPTPGWEILSGAGTNSISVRVTSASTNGSKEVKVEAVNLCGKSAPSTFGGIEVNTHIIANIGEDKTVCKTVGTINISGTRSFGSANLTTNFTTSGSGTFSNLPGGNNQTGAFTISYTPSQADKNAGQVKITLSIPPPQGNNNTGNQCGSAVDEMFIYFKPDATISNPANKSQVVCINSPIDPIAFTLGGTFSGATVTGLPSGVAGSFTNGTFSITGTPSVAGTFSYVVNTAGDCTQTSATGTITVDPLTTVTAGQAATDVVCQSATPAAITLSGASFGGKATTAAWSITSGGGTLSNTAQTATPQNITYTPAANYTGEVILTLTTNAPGKCAAVSATRKITVQPAPVVVAGTAATDVVCQSENPGAITLSGASFGGGATAAAWSITSGGGTLSSTALSASPQTVTYKPAAGYTGNVVLTLISDAPGKCSAVSATRTITVQPAATVNAGEAATDVLCQSPNPAAITLTGATFGGGATSAAWSITSGGGTLSSTDQTSTPGNITYTPAANYTGEVILTLTTNAPGTCAAVNDTRTIIIEPAAIVEAGGIEAGEEGACQSATPGAITLSGASLGGGAITAAWSITEGGGTLSSTAQTSQPELVTYTPAPDFTGTVTLTLTSAPAGNCSAVSDTRLIRISEALTVDAGSDMDLCSGSTVTLSDITLGSGVTSGRWEIVSGQGTLSSTSETANPETVTFTAPNQYKGETILRLTSNNPEGLCEAIYDERIINIQQEVTITTPPVNLGICSTQNAIFEVVASGDNLSYQWFFGETPIGGATSAKLTINQATSANSGSYTVQITGEASCGGAVVSQPVTLNVDEDIVIETQPVGGSYCVGSRVNLSVGASAGGAELTYEWFNANNQKVGTGASIALENIQISNSGNYYVIITGPAGFTCSTATSANAAVVVNPAPVITAIGNNIEVCSEGVEVNVTNGVEVSNHSSILWSVPEGMGTISNPTSLTNATYVPNGATGTVTLSLTVQGLDGCSEIVGTKNITIIPQPVITEFSYVAANNTATTGEFCETDSNTYTPHTAGENLANGTGAFTVDNTALTVNSSTGAITPNGTAPGEYIITYKYTVDSQTAGCTVAEKSFTVTIGEKPIADFSYEETPFCSDAVNPLPLMAANAIKGIFSSTTGLVFVDANTGEVNIAASTPGTYTITNTIAAANGCAEVKATADLVINQKPAAPGVSNIAYCLNDQNTPALTATTETGATLNWYTSQEGGTASATAPQPNTSTASTTTYWVSQTSAAGCESERASITVTINALPVVTAQAAQNVVCLGSPAQLSATGGVSYSWFLGENVIGTEASITHTPAAAGDYVYKVIVTDTNGCKNSAEVNVKIDAVTVAGTLTGPPNVCINNPAGTLQLSGHVGTVVKWESKPANGTTWTIVNGNTTPTLNFSGLTVATDYKVTVKNGVCAEAAVEARVNVDPLPVGGRLAFPDLVSADNTGRIFMICQGATSGYKPLALSGHQGTIIAWRYSINGAPWITIPGDNGNFTGSTLSAAQIQALNLPETTVFRVEIGSGACTPNAFSQTAIVSVIPTDIEPTPVTVSDDVVCLGDQVTLSSETGYSGATPIVAGGTFDNAGLKNHGWRFTNSNGTEFGFETNANNTNPDVWSRATPRDFPTASLTPNYNRTNQRWDAGVEDGNKGFAIVSGTNTSRMETSIFSIGSMDQAILTFDQAYNLTPGATISVEISTNGGATYETVLYSRTGPLASGNSASFGTGTPQSHPNNKIVLDLGNYLGKNNLRIRFNYVGARTGDIWAVDAIKVPEGPRGVTIEWNDYTEAGAPIFIGNTNSVQYVPKKIGLNIFEVKTKLVYDSAGNTCEVAENAENIEVFVFDKYITTTTANPGSCGNLTAQLSATVTNATGTVFTQFPTPDGYKGEWKIEPTTGYTLIDSNPNDGIAAVNDPNAILSANATGTFKASFVLLPTTKNANGVLYENSDCKPEVKTLDVEFKGCTTLDFDGIDDFVDLGEGYTGDYSVEAWIRPEAATGTIISTPQLEVNMADLPGFVTPNTRWYHIAVDSDGKLYVDGIASGTTISKTGSARALIGARWNAPNAENFFSGWIEEVRIWNGKISEKNIRFTMNQRLKATGNIGVEVDMAHPDAPAYGSLAGYYQLIATNILNGGYTPDLAGTAVNGKLRNMTTTQENTAPLPYTSKADGNWTNRSTWTQPIVWDYPNSTGINGTSIDWNIVRTSHNIQSGNRDIIVLGLLSQVNTLDMLGVNPNSWTTGGSGNKLFISHYLLLNGIIDLNGESQLVQPMLSIVDTKSSGYLDRDQQGTASSYNYNYWSSPVAPGASNANYSVGAVMMDGSTSVPQPINFGAAFAHADGGFTTPRKVSSYWLHRFHGTANDYFTWAHIGSTGTIHAGEGYSMKGTAGTAAILDAQNYTFRGLPNNGDVIPGSTGPDQNYLIGNPYPSAIDAKKFITDNLAAGHVNGKNVFNGTVYFWSHFANKTHMLEEYIGGYAAYNLAGGVMAVAIDERINPTTGKGGQVPQQFIPVGQAFFINTVLDPTLVAAMEAAGLPGVDGGQVIFKNSQRDFVKEDPSKSVFNSVEKKEIPSATNNSSSSEDVEQNKIWLKFKSPKGYHRQILVTADQRATDNFDLGFDAPLIEDNVEDMYWYFNNYQFVIQGVSDFNLDRELPLGIKVQEKGALSISIDELDNVPDDQNIFIKDSLTGIIHDLREEAYVTESEAGVFTDRFKLVFKDDTQVVEPEEPVVIEEGPFEIIYITGTRNILLKNPELNKVSRVYLNNMLGQQVHVYYDVPLERKIELPVNRFSAGIYIVKVHSEKGIFTKKVILE